MIFIFTPCKNKKEAERIGRALLTKRIAACCITIPAVNSLYRWKGKIESAKEAILLIKTIRTKSRVVRREIKKLHSYEIPAILTLPIAHVNRDYFQWMKNAMK